MNLLKSKKEIDIYNLITLVFFVFLASNLWADEGLESFCFERNVSLSQVEGAIIFLKKADDKIQKNETDHCLEISADTKRLPLFSKLINRRFQVIGGDQVEVTTKQHCKITLEIKRKKKVDGKNFQLGEWTAAKVSNISEDEISTSDLVLMYGKSGSLSVTPRELQVECVKTHSGHFNLVFYFEEKNKSKLSTEVQINSGESLDIGTVTNQLNQKEKTLGIPQTTISEQVGNEETRYFLKVVDAQI